MDLCLQPSNIITLVESHWLCSICKYSTLEAYHQTDKSRVDKSLIPSHIIPLLRSTLRNATRKRHQRRLLQMLIVNEAVEALHNLFLGGEGRIWTGTSLRNWLPLHISVETGQIEEEMSAIITNLPGRLLRCHSLILACYPLGLGFQNLRSNSLNLLEECEICLLHNLGKQPILRHGMLLSRLTTDL